MFFQHGIFIAPCKGRPDTTVFKSHHLGLTPTAGVDLIKRPAEDASICITQLKVIGQYTPVGFDPGDMHFNQAVERGRGYRL